MGQSLSQLYVHLTFGTQNRYPFIQQDAEERLHAYLAGILKNLESPALIINSVPDHVRILFLLSKNYALAKVVEEVKKQSSKWLKEFRKGYDVTGFQPGDASWRELLSPRGDAPGYDVTGFQPEPMPSVI